MKPYKIKTVSAKSNKLPLGLLLAYLCFVLIGCDGLMLLSGLHLEKPGPAGPMTYTVTYDSNNATSGSVPTDATNYEEGQPVTVVDNTGNLSRSGYSFIGWNTAADGSGTNYSSGSTLTMGSENITLYAKWTSEPTFTVTYNANSADSGSVPTDSTNYLEGQTVIVANNTGNLARSSYSFNGWNTAADGSGTPRTANSTFSMGNANVTLYAQWTPVYTVTYNANSATSGSVPTDSNTYANGATVPVANNTGNLFRTGYTFNAWNTAADGSGTTRTEGSTFSMGSANVTLYAEWGATYSQQIGTSANDEGHDIAIDSSQNVFIVGHTFGALQGTNAGNSDGFQRKSNSSGSQVWIDQYGTSAEEKTYGVAVDSSGNDYVGGFTAGAFPCCSNPGGTNPYLMKYNSVPLRQWIKMNSTAGDDYFRDIAVDSSGNVYVVGDTDNAMHSTNQGGFDIILIKYNSGGTRQWVTQIGSSANDYGHGVAVDSSGNAYITGYSAGGLDGNSSAGGNDLVLIKYNSSGTKQWTKQLGTAADDRGYGISLDSSGNSYITGYSAGGLDGNSSAGGNDLVLIKYDSSGNKQWTKQLGTSADDRGYGVAVDSSGNAWITGETSGGLDSNSNAGDKDVFVVKYNSSGIKQWTQQIGTSSADYGNAIAVDSSGNSYITGVTGGSFDGGTHEGGTDIFLLKYDTNGKKK